MMTMVLSYWPVFLAGILLASSLSVRGHFIVAKSEGPIVLALSQMCITGHLVSKAFFFHQEERVWFDFFPPMFAFALGLIILSRKKLKDVTYIALFVIFMAINYQMISLIPKLDTSLTANLFGDITTVENSHAHLISVLCIIFLLIYFRNSNRYIQDLIEDVHYGFKTKNAIDYLGHFILFLSLFEMGFLFSLAYIVLPTLFLSSVQKSLKDLVWCGITVASISAFFGLLASFFWGRLSTMPTQIMILVVLIILIRAKYRVTN